MLKSDKLIRIMVRASPMPYLGSPDPIRLSEDPYLEALPLFLNISNLDLVGESKFTKDEEGWIEENPLIRDATTIKAETNLPGNVALILIGITEGMKADDVTVQGFALDGSAALKSGLLVVADRAQRFAVRDTYGRNALYGVGTQGASGVVERCLLTKSWRRCTGFLIGPNLPPAQSAGHLMMTVKDNHLNENAHGFIIDAGFPFRSSSTEFKGKFAGRFENNEAIGSLTAKALITFTRNNAAETLPGSMAARKYLVDSRYRVIYSNGEFDETLGPSGRVWIDNPYPDLSDSSRALNNQLILAPESFE